MKAVPALALAALVLALASGPARATKVGDEIDRALSRAGALRMMDQGKTYTLSAGGKTLTAKADDFLRRRTPQEILASGLSTGCGDYAAAFYSLLRAQGAQELFVDAVQLSAMSELAHDDGHTGVAVLDPAIGRWVLVDPTNRVILSYDWDPKAKIYAGPAGRYWIWYAGPLEDYPAHDHPQLERQYQKALRSVPAAVWNRELVRLKFQVGASMKRSGGGFANPRVPRFLARARQVYRDLGADPRRSATLTLEDGGPGAAGDCRRTGPSAWDCPVGRDSALSDSFLGWLEGKVRRELASPL